MPGAQQAPAASRAKLSKAHERSHYRYAETSDIPCATVYDLFRALPGVPGLIATVACGITFADLTPASGCQDHTILPSALASLAYATPTRPSHPAPNVRGERAYAPLGGTGRPDSVPLICPTAQAKFFSREGWTRIRKLYPSGKSDTAKASHETDHSEPVIKITWIARLLAHCNGVVDSPPLRPGCSVRIAQPKSRSKRNSVGSAEGR
jgi:hypothetical protein